MGNFKNLMSKMKSGLTNQYNKTIKNYNTAKKTGVAPVNNSFGQRGVKKHSYNERKMSNAKILGEKKADNKLQRQLTKEELKHSNAVDKLNSKAETKKLVNEIKTTHKNNKKVAKASKGGVVEKSIDLGRKSLTNLKTKKVVNMDIINTEHGKIRGFLISDLKANG